jgi:adenosylhomocysteine nucleosidase
MSRLAFVAALEREVRPLVKHWRLRDREHAGRTFRFFENEEAVVVCGGIGPQAARRAAEAVIVLYAPTLIYSVGYAGALDAGLKVGDILKPARVIDANDGSSTKSPNGSGVLVSHSVTASSAQKGKLRECYGAQAVDMEGAAVARAAEARGVRFAALKVVSDEFNFELPATDRFVDTEGRFREARFAMFVAARPWLWSTVMRLARNSARATRVLCAELRRILAEEVSINSSTRLLEPR